MGTDPFVKTWWFLEAHDGSWLADAKHELFTRDPNAAMKWPNRTLAGWAKTGLHHALWLKIKEPTEHLWVDPASSEEPLVGESSRDEPKTNASEESAALAARVA